MPFYKIEGRTALNVTFPQITTAEREARGHIYTEYTGPVQVNEDGTGIEPVPPVRNTVFTKRTIRDAFRNAGIEAKLDAILDSDPAIKRDWLEAQEIDIDFLEVGEAIQGVLTTEDIERLSEILYGDGNQED